MLLSAWVFQVFDSHEIDVVSMKTLKKNKKKKTPVAEQPLQKPKNTTLILFV